MMRDINMNGPRINSVNNVSIDDDDDPVIDEYHMRFN